MPQARSVWNYPDEFWKLCEDAAIRGITSEQVLPTKNALSIRARFYGFKGAVKREAAKIKMRVAREANSMVPGQLTDSRDSRVLELNLRIDEVVCWTTTLDPATTKIQFMHRDNTQFAEQLRGFKAVGEVKPNVDLEESAERILNKLPKDKNYG